MEDMPRLAKLFKLKINFLKMLNPKVTVKNAIK